MENSVIVIGGGIAGITAAGTMSGSGLKVTLIERNNKLGGHVSEWSRLFPDRRKASEVIDYLEAGLGDTKIISGCSVNGIINNDHSFTVLTDTAGSITAEALLIATGFDLFKAAIKEEYGYNIYNNVITSAELEEMLSSGTGVLTADGRVPKRIGIIHCVGSRDEKVGNLYCSKVCCVTGVKQAIELKEMYPASEVYCFYMDLRMFDRHFEELYYEAQQKWGISFIRGRLSECAENADGSIVIKTEDTLTGKPLKMSVDLLILLVGIVPSQGTVRIAGMLGLKTGEDGFINSVDAHTMDNSSGIPGVFLAGALKGPATVNSVIADARAAAIQAIAWLGVKRARND
jgi:heterodisulfide reductase subunit A